MGYYLLYFITGIIVGFVNTLGGGGSSLIYPLLIFSGMSPHEAIGTARPAFLLQGFSGWLGFLSKKLNLFPFNLYVGIAALLGSIIGARISLQVPPEIMKKIIALVILMVTMYILFGKKMNNTIIRPQGKRFRPRNLPLNLLVFFLLGIYSGFIQTGIGFLIIIALMLLNKMNLTAANSVKALVILLAGIPALIIFARAGMIHWKEAGFLAAGTALGSWWTSRWSVEANEDTVKKIVAVIAILMAIKLLVT